MDPFKKSRDNLSSRITLTNDSPPDPRAVSVPPAITSDDAEEEVVTKPPKRKPFVFVYLVILLISVTSVYLWQNGIANKNLKALQVAQIESSSLKNVEKDKNQAVFLKSGQTYFGKISEMNKDSVTLTNIYYLRLPQNGTQYDQTKTSAPNQEVSLVKLGCEVHSPSDKMFINSQEISFWENIQPDGRISKAIADFEKQNPSGQKCE